MAESFSALLKFAALKFAALKNELIYRTAFSTPEIARLPNTSKCSMIGSDFIPASPSEHLTKSVTDYRKNCSFAGESGKSHCPL